MTYKLLDTVLTCDLPQHGLCHGDLGALVKVCGSAGPEVEFVTASERTQALVGMATEDLRPVVDSATWSTSVGSLADFAGHKTPNTGRTRPPSDAAGAAARRR